MEDITIKEIKWEALLGDNEDKEKVVINKKYPDLAIFIGEHLQPQAKNQLIQLLANSLDIIAWTPVDMTGIPREFVEHDPELNQSTPPVVQKKRTTSLERSISMITQVRDLV